MVQDCDARESAMKVGDLVKYKEGVFYGGYSLGHGLVVKVYPDFRDELEHCSVLWAEYPNVLLESTSELEKI